MPRGYFNDYDSAGERRSILPQIPLREALELSLDIERMREQKFITESLAVMDTEEQVERRYIAALEADLAYLRKVIEDGEQGLCPWRVAAAASAALSASPLGRK